MYLRRSFPVRRRIKLNLGCGEYRAESWVNVDLHTDVKPDVVADVTAELPLPDDCAKRIYAGHLLEHIPAEDVVATLNRWRRVAAHGCELLVVGPDCDRGRTWARSGRITDAEFRKMSIGGHRRRGEGHLWEATERLTYDLVRESGWRCVTPLLIWKVSNVWPVTSRVGWQFALYAVL